MGNKVPSKAHEHSVFERLNITTSLKPYVEHIKSFLQDETSVKAGFYEYILNKMSKYPNLEQTLKGQDLAQHKDLIEFVYATLSYDLFGDKSEAMWAFSAPFKPDVFYCNNELSKAWSTEDKNDETNKIIAGSMSKTQQLRLIYAFVFHKLYGYEGTENDIYYAYTDENTDANKFYLINFDFTFVALHTEGGVPKVDFDTFQRYLHNDSEIEKLEHLLPLTNFTFDGFAIVKFKDVRKQQLALSIENLVTNIDKLDWNAVYNEMIGVIKVLIQKNEIEIGLLPLLNVNNKFVFYESNASHSIIADTILMNETQETFYEDALNKYFTSPKPLILNQITDVDIEKYPFLKGISTKAIATLVIIPVFVHKKLKGFVELYASNKGIIHRKDIQLLNVVLPSIGQMFQNALNQLNAKIENVIKQNYTSLHPSVNWKFNETAWLHIKEHTQEDASSDLRKIRFEQVYPLYGAIDIRNSTVERNKALQKDMFTHIDLLQKTLISVHKKVKLDIIQEMLFECKKWTTMVQDFINSSDEYGLNNFLTFEVEQLFQHLKINNPDTQHIIDDYFKAIEEEKGAAHENRRKLEKSMQLINKVINTQLELMADELQVAFPFYFEKFRTDGVEYDIYIGQSIAPDRKFDPLYLSNVRLWQLKSMASIVRVIQKLSHRLPTFLDTTNLIFAHSNTIDISFRNDERRFDVEGSYNIRYQVIKKRIDKVHIKYTDERLTQPGKIAIVYFNQKEADEFIKFINSLIQQEIFLDDLEVLELEDLQGVAGLKALRVGVRFD